MLNRTAELTHEGPRCEADQRHAVINASMLGLDEDKARAEVPVEKLAYACIMVSTCTRR